MRIKKKLKKGREKDKLFPHEHGSRAPRATASARVRGRTAIGLARACSGPHRQEHPHRGTHRSLRDDNQRPAPSNPADPMQSLQLRMMQQFVSQSFRGSPAVAEQLLATMNNETMGDGISLQINQNAARSRQRCPSPLALLRSPSSQLSLHDGMTDVGTFSARFWLHRLAV